MPTWVRGMVVALREGEALPLIPSEDAMQPTLAPPTTQHVYRASIWHLPTFAWGIVGWLCLVTVNWLVHLPFHSAFDPFRDGLFPFTYCATVFITTPRPTLIVTPERFEYIAGRRRFWAYWDTVETVTRLPLHRSGLVVGEGLLLRALGPKQRLANRFIPLAGFDKHWRTGALGDDIRQYAPWLMEAH